MRPHILLTIILAVLCVAPAWAGMEETDAAYKRGNHVTALRECQPLAEQGNHAAQMLLGRLYMEGHGVPHDVVQAEMWFILAAMSGDPTAESLRNYIARDYMTDAQVGEAARLAWYWKPKNK
jgi:uncharacterized protein